ncbi:MAG: ABC-F family ATP-binding cassette domain-containing protein [Caedimonadaceae bacterium]|nr:MAG: ABC-F family ATP-binding cassette domain-containing protein [Caedimonadaceae bacterium]
MLTIKNMTYRVAGRTLFEGVNAVLSKGQHAGLVGRNGAGKSTLFKLILGETHSDQGEVEVQKGAIVGMVAQEIHPGEDTPHSFVLKSSPSYEILIKQIEQEQDSDVLAELLERLTQADTYAAPARASKILYGLGFDEDAQHKPLRSYSGGWRMRVALASVLFQEPDLLLLDEPTNHLDFEATIWLEEYLKSYPRTILMISHDRHMLNQVVDRIFHLDQLKLNLYVGDYDFYEKTRRERLLTQAAERAKQDERRAHIQKFVDRFRFKASKARQVQSRVKMLEKFDPLVESKDAPSIVLDFPEPDTLPPPLMTLEKVSTGYDEKVVLKNLNQRIDFEDRIALLGQNGNGKSTFAKLLAGDLQPLTGEIHRSQKLRVGFFHQHQIESLIPTETAFEHMAHILPNMRPDQVRARLGRFGFSQQKADVLVSKLSGGEKARLNFAMISATSPQLLILDEPTNHLDVETRESLVMAINAFPGAVILITHDWHLLELTADRLWLVANNTVSRFEGDLDDYKAFLSSGSSDVKTFFSEKEKQKNSAKSLGSKGKKK